MSDCIGPINIIPNNNQVNLQDVNRTITVIDNNCCTTVDVTQPITSVVQVLTGPMGKFPTEGPYGFTGSFDISGSLTVTGSIYGDTISSPYITGSFYGNGTGIFSGSFSGSVSSNLQDITDNGNVTTLPITASSFYGNGLQIVGNATVTGSLIVSGSNTFRNIGPAQFTGSTDITGSLSINGIDYEFTSASFDARILADSSSIALLSSSYEQFSASYNTGSFSGSFTGSFKGTASYAETASVAPAYLPLTGGTINGDVIVNGTASVTFLNVTYESASVIYSSGSNQLGDATNDTQLLIGTTKISGSFEVTGSANIPSITGSLQGTASYANQALTASAILGGKATHVPYFITDTTLATSSIYQSGSVTVIINQDNATTANPEALYVWQPSTSSFNVISGKGNLNNYLQLNIQNTNQGIDASSDVVATANNGSEVDNYIDMGINSENFAGFLGGPNDSYLYTHGHNFWIGNINDGYQTFIFNSSSLQPIITLNSDNAEVTGSLHGTASWAQNAVNANNATSASYALTASYASNVPATASFAISSSYAITASYALNALTSSYAISSSHANNADNALTSVSASHALVADNALTANYASTAGNGGVTQLIAGSGITLLPPGGQGAVTVISSGGGGVTIISGSLVTGSFVNTISYTFNHNLNTRTPIITVFDSNYNQIIPENIQLVDTASAIITFPTLESGFAIGSTGGTTGTAYSSSYALFATYADTASYFTETDPIFVAKSASLATTGSNIFRGNQVITGSLNVTSGITGSLLGTASYALQALSSSYAISSSFATSASYALSSSYALTASYALQALSSSYALTASYVNPLNQNVIITGSILMTGSSYISEVDYIDFDTTASNIGAVGRLKWNDTDGTLDLGLKGGNVTLQIGQEEVVRVVNKTGTNLTEAGYQVVRLDGAQGNRIKVALAKGDGDANSLDTLGLVTENIAINQEGFITSYGLVRNIDTRGVLQRETWSDGDSLYLSPTVFGGITNIPPVAPSHSVRLGYVVQSSPNGSIFVKVDNGYELDELHNVSINTSSLSYGDLLMRDGNNVWINSKNLSGSYTLTGSLTISGSSTFTNIGFTVLTGSVNITGSTTQTGNNTLIGNTVLSGSLEVSGSSNFNNSLLKITGSVNITGSTTQTGNNTLIGNTVLSGSIDVSGSQTFNGVSEFYGNHTLSGSNTILGNTIMSGSLEVSGSSNFHNSIFIVTGSTSILGDFNVKGTSVFSNTTFTVTGSQYFTGSSFINGNQSLTGNSTVTGSLDVLGNINVISGSSFTRWGNKLFNYGQFINTASISVTANVSSSFTFPVTSFKEGINIVSGSRVTFENTGLYNLELTAIANQGTGIRNLHIWFKKTGSNIDNSDTVVQLQNNTQTLVAWNFMSPFNANEYVEMWYHSDGANTSFPYSTAAGGFPASPSIRLTVTQIA